MRGHGRSRRGAEVFRELSLWVREKLESRGASRGGVLQASLLLKILFNSSAACKAPPWVMHVRQASRARLTHPSGFAPSSALRQLLKQSGTAGKVRLE